VSSTCSKRRLPAGSYPYAYRCSTAGVGSVLSAIARVS
jgi:hypothetical protein